MKAKGRSHVTAKMLKRSTRMKVSARCISDALHKRNVYFRKLREKPMLTIEDRKARMACVCKFKRPSGLYLFLSNNIYKNY